MKKELTPEEKILVTRLREALGFIPEKFDDEYLLRITKGTSIRAGVEFEIALDTFKRTVRKEVETLLIGIKENTRDTVYNFRKNIDKLIKGLKPPNRNR